MTLSGRIKTVRGSLSQEAFAEKISASQSAVTAWERGEGQFPKGDMLHKIREVFGVNINWLLTGEGAPYDKKETPKGEIRETKELWAKTEHREIAGEPRTFQVYGEGSPDQPTAGLGQAVDMLATVLQSGDQVYIHALMSNLLAFSRAVEESKRHSDRITQLEKRLLLLEEKLKQPRSQCCGEDKQANSI